MARRKSRSAQFGTLTFRQCQQARRAAAQAHQQAYARLGRAPQTSRNSALVTAPQIRTRLVRQAAEVVDADPELVGWLTSKMAERHVRPGRPRELTARTALICFIVGARVHRSFLISHLPELLGSMSWRTRRNLGIDYTRNGKPTQVTYNQLLDFFHDMADTFDAWDETLTELADEVEKEERARRASDLQDLVDRLCAASLHGSPAWAGDVCLDATLKWSHERPPGTLNRKLERRGADGDAGPAVSLSEVIGDDPTPAFEPTDPTAVAKKAITHRDRRKKSWPRTWSLGSGWVGRPNKTKAVHGVALHALVRAGDNDPCVIETFSVTPAKGDPADAVLPLLRRITDRRAADPVVTAAVEAGQAVLLGDVVADPGYTGAGVTRWHEPVRALGAMPVGRLHRTNQEGLRSHEVGRGKRAGIVQTIAGRPMCECVAHTTLPDLRFPAFPYTTGQLESYQQELLALDQFSWITNGSERPDGKRSWLAPHQKGPDGKAGGCPHCVTTSGPVTGENGKPRKRCCTVKSRLIPSEVTSLHIGVPFGSPDWYQRWNRRNRSEGTFGVMKNQAVIGWGRDYHRFVGLARETLVAVFAVVAFNAHMLDQWRARQALVTPTELSPHGPVPDRQPSEAAPGATDARAEERLAPKRGPLGLEFLATPRAGP